MTRRGARVLVVMGVSGAGKTTVARLLADRLACRFQEGDDLHPPANRARMQAGQPLTDADRQPWLRQVAAQIGTWLARLECGVITCSALKRAYRDRVIGQRPGVTLVYLRGSEELIRRRLALRRDHFMPVDLLHSQFATLEEPTPDEHPVVVAIDGSPTQIVAQILRRLPSADGATSSVAGSR